MDIKRGNAIILSLDSFNEGSKLTRRLMGDDYVTLPFTLAEPISFAIGDYVDIVLGGEQTVFGRYELVSAYKPTYNTNTGCYDYQLRLDAYYFQWKNRQMKYNPQTGGNELSFSLTSSIGTHAAILLQNLVANGFFFYDNAHTPFTVDYDETVDTNKAKLVQYDNISILDALTSIAKTFECEWWVTDSVIHFGKCQKGDSVQEVIFEIGSNVSEMSKSDNGATFATRLYCFGSDRNLPKTYKKSVSEDLTKSAVVQRRLMLPTNAELTQESAELIDGKYILSDNGYLQVAGISDDKVVEGVFVDDDIYPKTDCFVSDVRTYTDTREEDGEVITQTFYRLIDGSGFNFNTDMLLEDATLHIIFTSGSMNGMDFECHYNNDDNYYEVVVNESYGRSLPDTNLHPEKGDHFAVYNWDASKLEESKIIPKASNELLASAVKKFEKAKIDPAQYTCTEDCYEESYTIRELGDKIRLVNPAYFENGRSSRVTGIEINLDLPYDHPKYIVSEKADYIYQSHVENTEELTFNGQSYQGANVGGGGLYLIKTNDTARPSDSNAYSAKRALEEFLSAKEDDTAQGLVGFVKGLWVKTKGLFGFSAQGDVTARSLKTTGSSGGTTPDADNVTQKNLGLEVSESGVIGGILRVAKSLLTKNIQSLNFSNTDSLTGTGWQLTDDDGNGRSRLIVDDAVFRGKVTLNELGVRKLTAMGGNYVFSPAAGIIEEVDYYGYKVVPGEETPEVELLGYEYIKVPWVLRLIPLSLRGRYLSRKKWVRSTMTAEDYDRVKFYRCWLKADDGSTQTINTWQVGMLARCQTFDTSQIENGNHAGSYDKPQDSGGTYSNVTNKLYWRAVVAKGEGIDKEHYQGETIALDDGRKHNYIDLANYLDNGVQLFLTGSDHVSAGDHIVCFGDWKDRQLANLVTIETIGSDAPAVKEFVGVGYTDDTGTAIDWSLDSKVLTRISPISGNKFVAPEFKVVINGQTHDLANFMVNTDGVLTKVQGDMTGMMSVVEQTAGGYAVYLRKLGTEESDILAGFTLDSNGNIDITGSKITLGTGSEASQQAVFEDGKLRLALLDVVQIVAGGIRAQTIDCQNATFNNVNVSGKVTATNGKIAGFNISGNGLTNGPEFTNDAYIIFRNDAHSCFAGIGGNVLATYTAQRAVARFENEDSNDQWSFGANYAMILSAKNHSRKNVALQINHGQTRGLRPEVRGVNSNTTTTLTDDDHTIIATSGCTLTLPSSPQEGQQYHIICMTTGTVKIQSTAWINWKYLSSSSPAEVWQLGKDTEYDLTASVREAWLTFTGTEWHLTQN